MNKNGNIYDAFEQLIREKIESFSFSYNGELWNKIKSSLPNSYNLSLFKILTLIFVSTSIISTITYFILTNNSSSHKHLAPPTIPQNNISIENLPPDDKKATDTMLIKNLQLQKPSSTKNLTSTKQSVINNNQITDIKPTTTFSSSNISEPTNPIYTNQPTETTNKINTSIIASAYEGCAPFTITFYLNEKNNNYTYLWNFGDGLTSTEMQPQHTYTKPGIYKTTLTIRKPDDKTTITYDFPKTIIIYEKPKAIYEIKQNNETYLFTSLSEKVSQIKWFFGDGTFSTENNPYHTYKTDGSYLTKMIVTNEEGCSDSVSQKINVTIEFNFFIPNAFTPDGDGLNDTFGPTGIDFNEIKNYVMQIFSKDGILIFETTDLNKPWDGKINSYANPIPENYIWHITIETKSGQKKSKKGYIIIK